MQAWFIPSAVVCTKSGSPYDLRSTPQWFRSGSPRLQFWLPPNFKSGFPRSKYGSPCSSRSRDTMSWAAVCLEPPYVWRHLSWATICLETFVLRHYMSGDTCHKTLYVLRHLSWATICLETLVIRHYTLHLIYIHWRSAKSFAGWHERLT